MSRLEASSTSVDQAPVFAALGDATRLEIVSRLCDGQPRSISQLTEGLDLTRQAVTKHLRVLECATVKSQVLQVKGANVQGHDGAGDRGEFEDGEAISGWVL